MHYWELIESACGECSLFTRFGFLLRSFVLSCDAPSRFSFVYDRDRSMAQRGWKRCLSLGRQDGRADSFLSGIGSSPDRFTSQCCDEMAHASMRFPLSIRPRLLDRRCGDAGLLAFDSWWWCAGSTMVFAVCDEGTVHWRCLNVLVAAHRLPYLKRG